MIGCRSTLFASDGMQSCEGPGVVVAVTWECPSIVYLSSSLDTWDSHVARMLVTNAARCANRRLRDRFFVRWRLPAGASCDVPIVSGRRAPRMRGNYAISPRSDEGPRSNEVLAGGRRCQLARRSAPSAAASRRFFTPSLSRIDPTCRSTVRWLRKSRSAISRSVKYSERSA